MTPRVASLSIFLALAGLIAITLVGSGLPSYDPAIESRTFMAGAVPTWLFIVVWLTHLRREYSHRNEGNRAAVITAATWVTLGRGFLVSLVAGFVLGPRPAGRALWFPGAVYALAVLADGGDGALARWTDRVTALGAKLDVTTDAVGLFVAPVVGIRWGRLPPWYLALALAYPTFWLAIRLRRTRALPIHLERLRRDPRARFFAGAQMILVATALLPVLPRAFTWAAATAAMLPTLALFAGEWRLVTRDV
jgi:CDP-diacylglycerol--glycerol-3-phosphate 3-phosphatidyltransferase